MLLLLTKRPSYDVDMIVIVISKPTLYNQMFAFFSIVSSFVITASAIFTDVKYNSDYFPEIQIQYWNAGKLTASSCLH